MSVSLDKELKNLTKSGKYYLGVKKTIKSILRGEAKMVIIADNMPLVYRSKIEKNAKLSNIPLYVFKGTSMELGSLLGKPFKVSSISIIDTGESRILDLAGTS
ncbi:ribosomal protein L30E [Caldisphaera lagunensis DSM 15908]|uniref:Large ribosomal subunit protein eL30 n=1 Tax=Caldisphaera lagunensis (strain DSM 15908 / JCM 11604 / ANMR 0165 / IC-154) TaxID=1056495 RepID=L0ABD0_CALLD|nr:50S ribosomal protein L30e [Caldisphaera lagunensis]AFZ71203.1 ribosomal protein L30E [Caldisphaera lagunensis DSM 15908]